MTIRSQARPAVVAVAGLFALLVAACSGGATSTTTPAATTPTSAAATSASAPASAAVASSPSSSGSQAGTGTTDACALVSAAEAQPVMGGPVATTRPGGSGPLHTCDYLSADGRTVLSVSLTDPNPDTADKTAFDVAYSASQPVAGVGGDAYFNADLSALAVWQNGTILSVTVSNGPATSPAQAQAALTTLAQAILAGR